MRLGLALIAIAGGLALTFVLLNGHGARAASVNMTSTFDNPVGTVVDNASHIWVAEPNCNPAPSCPVPGTPNGAIEEFSLVNGQPQEINRYQPPTPNPPTTPPFNPTYLALDNNGHVWFTDPVNNQIGKLTISGNTWTSYSTGISTNAQPYGIVLDGAGKVWFTERAGTPQTGTQGVAKIGFLDPAAATPTIVETALPAGSSGSQPFGMTYDATDNLVWFTEDTAASVGVFTPTANGTISIQEISTAAGNPTPPAPHMITYDGKGHLWYSEQGSDLIGELTIKNPLSSSTAQNFNVAGGICPTPGVTPTPCPVTFISGIAVDSSGNVWFDEFQNSLLGVLNPTANSVNTIALPIHSGPAEGLAVDGTGNVWVSMLYSKQLGELPAGSFTTGPTPTPTSTGTPPPTLPAGPVSPTWYFAEGHIGNGFQEYLTIQNPDAVNTCFVQVQYLLPTGTVTLPTSITVNPNTRLTENVNNDLHYPSTGKAATDVSTTLTVTNSSNCKGVVAERPMYFKNVFGVNSGHDALGATHLGTTFYFPDVASYTGYRDFITILNPTGASNPASVTVTYYQGGVTLGTTSSASVPPGTRYTITPPNFGQGVHVSAQVVSSMPVAVELPAYFNNFVAGNAGTVSGATVAVGATAASNDWRFAEGYVGSGFQEYLKLANFSATTVTASAVLEYDNSATLTVPVTIGPDSTQTLDVNSLTLNPGTGTCVPTACGLSQNVSVEIKGASAADTFVAERQLYFHYLHKANGRTLGSTGGSDILGQSGTAAVSSYSFAEGYTNGGYDEWLSLQNPTTAPETIWVTLVNGFGQVYEFSDVVGPQTRATVDIVKTVLSNMCSPGAASQCWEVSMTVQTLNNGGVFVAERPMYFNASGGQGGTDVLGYTGN